MEVVRTVKVITLYLQVLQISVKFLLQMASDQRNIHLNASQLRYKEQNVTQIFSPSFSMIFEGSRTTLHWTTPVQTTPTWMNPHQDNSPPELLPTRTIPQRDTTHQDDPSQGQLPNQDNSPLGQLPTRTIPHQDNSSLVLAVNPPSS